EIEIRFAEVQVRIGIVRFQADSLLISFGSLVELAFIEIVISLFVVIFSGQSAARRADCSRIDAAICSAGAVVAGGAGDVASAGNPTRLAARPVAGCLRDMRRFY